MVRFKPTAASVNTGKAFGILSRNAFASISQVLISGLLLLATYRVLTHHLSVAEIGLWSLIMASTAVARLSEMGLGSSVTKYVANDIGEGRINRAAATVSMGLGAILIFVGATTMVLVPLYLLFLHQFVPANLLAAARALLPFAAAGLLLSSLTFVCLGAIDGCQRADIRAGIQSLGSASQFAAVIMLVPAGGLLSLGWVNVIYNGSQLLMAAIGAVVLLNRPAKEWLSLDRERLANLFRYGGALQIAAIGQLLFDPILKAFLATYGNLTMVGYYEMANRLILQARGSISAAFNVIVPYVAKKIGSGEVNSESLAQIYARTHELLIVAVAIFFSMMAMFMAPFLWLWLGKHSSMFLAIALVLVLGWALNTTNVAAYYIDMAAGRLRFIMYSHLMIGTLNVILGSAGGALFGGYGVIAGAAIALWLGSGLVNAGFHHDHDISPGTFFPRSTWLIVGSAALLGCIISTMPFWLRNGGNESHGWLLPMLFSAAIAAILLSCLALRHPVVSELLGRFRRST